MHFDLAAIPQSDAHALLVSAVLPRPIALATTADDRPLMERLGFAEWKDGQR